MMVVTWMLWAAGAVAVGLFWIGYLIGSKSGFMDAMARKNQAELCDRFQQAMQRAWEAQNG